MVDRADRIVSHVEGPTVLDLGAVQHDADNADADGWLHGRLVDAFPAVIGVDILADEVAALAAQGYEMRHADVCTMDLDVVADTVVAGELIEHIANPGQMLDRAREHLRPGGKLVLSTPNPWAVVRFRRRLTGDASVNDEHVAWYGPAVLRQLLERHGFVVESIASTRRDHRGLMRLAQVLDSDVFGGSTWVVAARRTQ